eukprot:363422-Chlamydomonas_euryale.AAC.3
MRWERPPPHAPRQPLSSPLASPAPVLSLRLTSPCPLSTSLLSCPSAHILHPAHTINTLTIHTRPSIDHPHTWSIHCPSTHVVHPLSISTLYPIRAHICTCAPASIHPAHAPLRASIQRMRPSVRPSSACAPPCVHPAHALLHIFIHHKPRCCCPPPLPPVLLILPVPHALTHPSHAQPVSTSRSRTPARRRWQPSCRCATRTPASSRWALRTATCRTRWVGTARRAHMLGARRPVRNVAVHTFHTAHASTAHARMCVNSPWNLPTVPVVKSAIS